MGKKKKRSSPAQKKAPAPVFQSKTKLFSLPKCSHCHRKLPYRFLLARGLRFFVLCRCGNRQQVRVGKRCLLYWGMVLLVCVGLVRLLMGISPDVIPLFLFTVFAVAGAFFLHPLTLTTKQKKQKNENTLKTGDRHQKNFKK